MEKIKSMTEYCEENGFDPKSPDSIGNYVMYCMKCSFSPKTIEHAVNLHRGSMSPAQLKLFSDQFGIETPEEENRKLRHLLAEVAFIASNDRAPLSYGIAIMDVLKSSPYFPFEEDFLDVKPIGKSRMQTTIDPEFEKHFQQNKWDIVAD